jgi:hypothetical protein
LGKGFSLFKKQFFKKFKKLGVYNNSKSHFLAHNLFIKSLKTITCRFIHVLKTLETVCDGDRQAAPLVPIHMANCIKTLSAYYGRPTR